VPRRKFPIDKARESAIAARLLEAREQWRLEQTEVASKAGLTRDQWQNIERGRTPIRYASAFQLRESMGLSLDWLAGMPTAMSALDCKAWPKIGANSRLNKAIFSDVAMELLNHADRGIGLSRNPAIPLDFPRAITERAEWADFFATYISQRLAMVVPNKVGELGHELLEAINRASSQFENSPAMAKHFFEQISEYLEWQRNHPTDASSGTGENVLTYSAIQSKSSDVKPKDLWPMLKKRLQKATAETTGAKTALADFLGVELSRVSQWLSDSKKTMREPGAEYALLMQAWLALPESKRMGK